MSAQIRFARTVGEMEEVFRFRYGVYVEEMGRTQKYADHQRKRIEEPLDRSAEILAAHDNGRVVGTVRYNAGTAGSFGIYDDLYAMRSFDRFYPSRLSLTTKLMVAADYRRSTLPLQLAIRCYQIGTALGVLFDFIDCNPPLVEFFERLGYRQVMPHIKHPEFGTVVPMVLVVYDLEHLAACRSPFLKHAGGCVHADSVDFFYDRFGRPAECHATLV